MALHRNCLLRPAAGHAARARDNAACVERELMGEFLITNGYVGPGCLGDR